MPVLEPVINYAPSCVTLDLSKVIYYTFGIINYAPRVMPWCLGAVVLVCSSKVHCIISLHPNSLH